jgi:hypothetical protein
MPFPSFGLRVAARKGAALEPLKFEVRRDGQDGAWYAVATDESGIVTEAPTLEALRERLKALVADLLERQGDCPIELELCDELASGCCELTPR